MSEEITYSRSENYSRSRGRRHRVSEETSAPVFNHHFKDNLLPVNWWLILGWSVLVSLLSVADPFLTGLADNLQSQNLYAGFAMQSGQVPYTNFFGTSGVLYYLMLAVGSLLGSTLGIAALQAIALFVAGVYFNKLIAYFSKSEDTANSFLHWFYIFILALGFGGVYSSIFVLPFLLTSLWFLVRYFAGAVKDEAFIFYGIDAALVFLIDPKTALLWIVAAPVLAVYAGSQGQKARSFYQFLVALFGFLLILYTVGYYAFTQQILGKAIQQTFIQNISLDFGSQDFLIVLVTLGVALVLTGFIKGFLKMSVSLRDAANRHMKLLVLGTFLVQLLFIVASSDFVVSKLLVLLPYGFLMNVLGLSSRELGLHRRQVEDDLEPVRSFSYMKSHFFVPVLVCLYAPLTFAFHYLQEGSIGQERTEIARYIREHSESADAIYAWDDSAQVYLKSKRLGTSKFITAEPYLTTKANQDSLLFDLGKNTARYIVVNSSVPLLDGIQSILDAQYAKVDLELGTLVLYEKK